jgi:hypothetical protein
MNRMQEMNDPTIPKMLAEEIAKFAHNTEKEMFLLFGRDTGTRYKAKYRSLMFNIKDPKNFTLFRKICDKSIRPYQLVSSRSATLHSNILTFYFSLGPYDTRRTGQSRVGQVARNRK